MSISDATICSNALGLLSEAPILSLLDESVRANHCNNFFAITRDALLEDHPWNFASGRVQLVAVSTPTPIFAYSYTFQLPTDYLKVQEVSPSYIEYAIEADRLLADASKVAIAYTRRLTDYSKYSPLFILALQYKMAALMAPLLKQDYKLATLYEQMYDLWIKRAKIADAQASRSKEATSDDLITVRKVA